MFFVEVSTVEADTLILLLLEGDDVLIVLLRCCSLNCSSVELPEDSEGNDWFCFGLHRSSSLLVLSSVLDDVEEEDCDLMLECRGWKRLSSS